MERRNTLKRETDTSSFAEVVRNALHLCEALIEETDDGKQFFTRATSGVMATLRVFL